MSGGFCGAEREDGAGIEREKRRRMKLWMGIVTTTLLAVSCAAAVLTADSPRIEFDREAYDALVVEYGDAVPAQEIHAVLRSSILHRQGIPLDVETEPLVYDAPGEYEVRYAASYGDLSAGGSYLVRVVDTTPPELTVDRETLAYACADALDGDLTDRVVVTDNGDHVVFTVTDSSGNRTEQIVRRDVTPPVLTLGAGILDYTCVDDTDGDLRGSVTVYESGGVLYYEVSDRHGNRTSASRKLSGGDRVVYLTFDDGPGPWTAGLLDTLARYGAKATFFVVGTSEHMDLLPRMKAEGHSVGAHSETHNYSKVYASVEAYFDDLERVEQKIEAQLGERTALIRFPGGGSNTVSRKYQPGIMTELARLTEERGYVYFDWNVSSADTSREATTESVAGAVKNGILNRNVSVVLQHDVKEFSVAAVEEVLRWGRENGVLFLPLTPQSTTARQRISN